MSSLLLKDGKFGRSPHYNNVTATRCNRIVTCCARGVEADQKHHLFTIP